MHTQAHYASRSAYPCRQLHVEWLKQWVFRGSASDIFIIFPRIRYTVYKGEREGLALSLNQIWVQMDIKCFFVYQSEACFCHTQINNRLEGQPHQTNKYVYAHATCSQLYISDSSKGCIPLVCCRCSVQHFQATNIQMSPLIIRQGSTQDLQFGGEDLKSGGGWGLQAQTAISQGTWPPRSLFNC